MSLWLAFLPGVSHSLARDHLGLASDPPDCRLVEKSRTTLLHYRSALFPVGLSGDPSGSAAGNRMPDVFSESDGLTGPETNQPKYNHSWETGAGKSYLVPALEIPAFILLLNGFDRLAFADKEENGKKIYASTPGTFWDHVVHGPWVFDKDAFDVNQLGHPYQGSIYYGLARSAGLGYWESLGFTFAGSLLWEWGGETTDPSINDQISTGIGGTFLGEPLFRIASLLLEGHAKPGFWRELGAAVFSPPTGLNRQLFGERFSNVFPSHSPAVFWRVRVDWTINTTVSGQSSEDIEHNLAAADFAMSYGLPGQPGYSYERPFDYFRFELETVARAGDPVEEITTRGLLFGKKVDIGDDYRGIWGLYGGYDYESPHIFRISSTSLSFGTTAQWWLSQNVALQGSGLAGLGYGAGGNVTNKGERHYHYGAVPQGLLSMRLILGDRAMLEMAGREYYVTAPGSTQPPGSELIGRYSAGLTVRIFGPHALGIQYLASLRDVYYPDSPDIHQRKDAVSISYTFLSDTGFGAVEWRDRGQGVSPSPE
jgi:Domain of unknown function (DUF3943)